MSNDEDNNEKKTFQTTFKQSNLVATDENKVDFNP